MSKPALSSYSRLDRALHKLAFNSKALQEVLADMEHSMYARQWRDISVEEPIFITSLPRAGTTILLQTLYRMCNLATHTYRDMPFVLTPLIWRKFSRIFRRTSAPSERAHSDGLAINEDSPEAFEEVLWARHFPAHYSRQGIRCWAIGDDDGAFGKVFREHMRKIVLLRQSGEHGGLRYISKNNANIARIGYLQNMFPGAKFVVPLRHPVEQAVSLLRQHQNFGRQHADDAFSLEYMADIGHFEFGELHRAIQFPGLREFAGNLSPATLDYWIAYWITAFSEVSQCHDLHFVSFERLCARPEAILNELLDHLDLEAGKISAKQAAQGFRSPSERRHDYTADPVLVEQAMECYKGLQSGQH